MKSSVAVAIVVSGLLGGCALLPSGKAADLPTLVSRLSNSDVKWDGNVVGLCPTVTGPTAKQFLDLGEEASPYLRQALSVPDKFAAAHVLLTKIETRQFQVSASHWNGLRVDLNADGSVDLHPEQMDEIKALWK